MKYSFEVQYQNKYFSAIHTFKALGPPFETLITGGDDIAELNYNCIEAIKDFYCERDVWWPEKIDIEFIFEV
jgi:hypothetical protein